MSIQFTDVCFITEDVLRLRAFYETVFDVTAEGNEVHSTLIAGEVTFTFDYVAPLQENSVFHYVSAGGANNVIIGFNVDDVDAEYKRLLPLGVEMLNSEMLGGSPLKKFIIMITLNTCTADGKTSAKKLL